MKTKSKILILLLTLALLCGILFVSVSAADTTATVPANGFTATYADGKVDTVSGTGKASSADDYLALYNYVNKMTAAAKITLYQDYTVTKDKSLAFKYDGTELDLNGKTITATTKFGYGFIRSNTGTTTGGLYVYSSKTGAQILAEKDGGFIFGAGVFTDVNGVRSLKNEGKLTVGMDKAGKRYAGNLTIKGTTLLAVVSNTVIDGIAYVNNKADNVGCIQYQLKEAEVTIRNCDLSLGKSPLFAVRYGENWSATVDNSRIFMSVNLLVGKGDSDQIKKSDVGVTFTNTDIYSNDTILNTHSATFPITLGEGVRLNRVQDALPLNSDHILAHDNTKMFTSYNGEQYPTFYEVVAQGNAATINFKQGDTVLDTQVWKVGSTPNYVGTIALNEVEGDSAKVLAPKWSMNGNDTVVATSDGTAVDATYTLVETPKAFEATANGTTTYYIDTAYETFYRFIQSISATGTKVKLYTDYEIPNASQALIFKKENTELDLNGRTIKTDWKYGGGFLIAQAKSVSVYSSVKGAQLLATVEMTTDNQKIGKGGGFIFGVSASGGLTIGKKAEDTYIGNLTAEGTCLLSVYADASIEGIIYRHTAHDNTGLIQFAKTATVTVNNCEFNVKKSLFAARDGNGEWKAEVTNSRIYTTETCLANAHYYMKGKDKDTESNGTTIPGLKAGSVTLKNTDLYSTQNLQNFTFPNDTFVWFPVILGDGVRMNRTNANLALVDDTLTRARIDEAAFEAAGQSCSVSYLVTAKANAVPITFKSGDTALTTEPWAKGSTPKYNGIVAVTEGDPESDTVPAPSGRWLIDGKSIPLTEEQTAAGTTLIAVAELINTPKAFQATIGTTTYYFIDTEFATLSNYVASLTAPAKIKLYTNYTLPQNGYLAFKQAGSELDLNGKTLKSDYKLNNGIINTTKNLYVYSTAPGAQLLAEEPFNTSTGKGGGFIFTATSGSNLVVGRAPETSDVTVYPLTAKGTCLVLVGSEKTTAEFNNVTYVQSISDNAGYLQFNGTSTAITVNNCDFLLTVDSQWQGLFGLRLGNGGWKATVNGSRIYIAGTQQLTFVHSDMKKDGAITVTPEGATFTNTVIYAANSLTNNTIFPITFGEGVKMNKAYNFPLTDGYVAARIDETKETLNGKDVTLLYEVVAKANAFEATFKNGETTLATEAWKTGSKPTLRQDLFGTYYLYAAATEGITADTTYPAKLKTTESKITGNLTLYANITFNLYFRKDGFIKGVKYNGNTTSFSETTLLNGEEYYLFKIDDISPKDLSKAFTLEVLLASGETTATYTVNTSLSKYAAAVLANEATDAKTVAGKNLVLALLDYVYEMSKETTLGNVGETTPGMVAIKKGLDYYKQILNYGREEWNGIAPTPEAGNITDASLKLASTPGFIFYLSTTASEDGTIKDYTNSESVSVTINGVTKSYKVTTVEGSKPYIIVDDIHVSKYNDIMTVELDGTSFSYSLGAYMKGYTTIPEYAKALYNYVCAAKAYLEAQGN